MVVKVYTIDRIACFCITRAHHSHKTVFVNRLDRAQCINCLNHKEHVTSAFVLCVLIGITVKYDTYDKEEL